MSPDAQALTLWSDCRHCGLLQPLPPPTRGFTRLCCRCGNGLGSGAVFSHLALAFAVGTLFLFLLAQFYSLMDMQLLGQTHTVRIVSGVMTLADRSFASLALWMLAIAVAAPLGRILCLISVLRALPHPARHARALPVFRLCEKLRPWAMLDVLLLAAIVASSKLRDMAQIHLESGFWSLTLLVAALTFLDMSYDRRAVWDLLQKPPRRDWKEVRSQRWASCSLCGWLQPRDRHKDCSRCGEAIHERKPHSLQRTWALVIAGCILYIPANVYPVLTTISFYRLSSTTLMGGVRQLLNGEDWPLAIVLFIASVVIPLLKLVGLACLAGTVHNRSRRYLVLRTQMFRIIRLVGKWANVDVFVGALLTGLVMLGDIATIRPADGALAFGAVVVLTMAAAECFDPRLLWDAAGENGGPHG